MLGSWFRQMINNDHGSTDSALPPPTEEQQYFLQRLERLAGLQRDVVMWDRLNEAGQELLRRAIYSTYCDCVDLGVARAAQRVLHPNNATPSAISYRAGRKP